MRAHPPRAIALCCPRPTIDNQHIYAMIYLKGLTQRCVPVLLTRLTVPSTLYPDQEKNYPKCPRISHFPKKNIENGSRSPRPTFHTSSFILHPYHDVFRRRFRPSAITHFFPHSCDGSIQRDTPGGGRGHLSSQSRWSMACGKTRLPFSWSLET